MKSLKREGGGNEWQCITCWVLDDSSSSVMKEKENM